jgi:hypothetical protein
MDTAESLYLQKQTSLRTRCVIITTSKEMTSKVVEEEEEEEKSNACLRIFGTTATTRYYI